MSLLSQVSNIARWPLLEVGTPSPPLSLTADEGMWIKIGDFKGQANVVLVFFGSLNDGDTDAWLKRWQVARTAFEELEAAIFGVNTARVPPNGAPLAVFGSEQISSITRPWSVARFR